MYSERLRQALNHPIWRMHRIGDTYTMDQNEEVWKLAYYPIFEDGKTKKEYPEPRALMERPAVFDGIQGIDFREVPLRYLHKIGLVIDSNVRRNLIDDPGYTPYCGAGRCGYSWPRTVWDPGKEQFICRCGWVSQFPAEFIRQYKNAHNI